MSNTEHSTETRLCGAGGQELRGVGDTNHFLVHLIQPRPETRFVIGLVYIDGSDSTFVLYRVTEDELEYLKTCNCDEHGQLYGFDFDKTPSLEGPAHIQNLTFPVEIHAIVSSNDM